MTVHQVEQQFKVLWADHGDECALQYGGSGAMKSGFTRTGKRTIGGILDDAVKFAQRYYLNNFQDGRKQDALDLITGGHKLGDETTPFEQQLSPNLPFTIALLLLVVGSYQVCHLLIIQQCNIPNNIRDYGSCHPTQSTPMLTHAFAPFTGITSCAGSPWFHEALHSCFCINGCYYFLDR